MGYIKYRYLDEQELNELVPKTDLRLVGSVCVSMVQKHL